MVRAKTFLICGITLFLMSCATTPEVPMDVKCRQANDYINMASSVVNTNLSLANETAVKAVTLCPSPDNMAFLAYIDSLLGWHDMAKVWADIALQKNQIILIS
ncbi:MAG: hypothetical protein AB1478_05645 [Nitrospirota bacterium]